MISMSFIRLKRPLSSKLTRLYWQKSLCISDLSLRNFQRTVLSNNIARMFHGSHISSKDDKATNIGGKEGVELRKQVLEGKSATDHGHTQDDGHHHEETPGPRHSHEHEHSHKEGLFGHTHSHHGPNELLSVSSEAIKTNPAVRITWIGLLVNIALAASKGVGGYWFHSQSLIADSIHSLSDTVADILTLATVNVANKVGNPTKFPLGYGKLETLGSVFVSGILLFAGVSVGWSSLLQVFEYTFPTYIYELLALVQFGHSHSHGSSLGGEGSVQGGLQDSGHTHSHLSEVANDQTRTIPDINAAWLAGSSIVIKELLYRKTLKVAEEMNSKVLVANAWHHRVDSLTALVAVLTVAGGNLFNIVWLDAVGGLCVSALIVKAGWGSFKSAILELIDRGEKPDSELYDTIDDILKNELQVITDNDFKVSKLSVVTAGAVTNLYITLVTSSEYKIQDLNTIEKKLNTAIRREDKFVRNIFTSFKFETKK